MSKKLLRLKDSFFSFSSCHPHRVAFVEQFLVKIRTGLDDCYLLSLSGGIIAGAALNLTQPATARSAS